MAAKHIAELGDDEEINGERRRVVVNELKTRDAAEAEASFREAFGAIEGFNPIGDRQDYGLARTRITYGPIKFSRLTGSGQEFQVNLPGVLLLALVTRGTGAVAAGSAEYRARPMLSAVTARPGRRSRIVIGEDAATYALVVPVSTLRQHAEACFDSAVQIDETSDFNAEIDLRQGPGLALSRNVPAQFSELCDQAQAGLSAVASPWLMELLIGLVVATSVGNVRQLLSQRVAGTGKATLDKAVDYLTAHAGEPVSMAALARDLGVSLRSLQLEFQKKLGRSPLEFLFECRLKMSRARLLESEMGTTVTAVATQSGFTNLGAFAARYRETYGELPSETLLRALKR